LLPCILACAICLWPHSLHGTTMPLANYHNCLSLYKIPIFFCTAYSSWTLIMKAASPSKILITTYELMRCYVPGNLNSYQHFSIHCNFLPPDADSRTSGLGWKLEGKKCNKKTSYATVYCNFLKFVNHPSQHYTLC
jgi:hypothetical protein